MVTWNPFGNNARPFLYFTKRIYSKANQASVFFVCIFLAVWKMLRMDWICWKEREMSKKDKRKKGEWSEKKMVWHGILWHEWVKMMKKKLSSWFSRQGKPPKMRRMIMRAHWWRWWCEFVPNAYNDNNVYVNMMNIAFKYVLSSILQKGKTSSMISLKREMV